MDSSTAFDDLRTFRHSLHRCFDRRADALFELCDAILTAGVVPSPVHLSLEPAHRRGWGSLYAALERGRIDAEALHTLMVRHPLDGGQPPVYAVDVSVWARCDAETSPERGFYYHPSRHSAGQPIVAGWAYQWIAQLGFARESWVAPVDAKRVRPTENTNEVAAGQVEALLNRLPQSEGVVVPLFVFDAGYDPVQLQRRLTGRRVAILVRLRAGRCFYADPVGPPAKTGRPRRHGPKLDTKDPETWPTPSAEHACEDAQATGRYAFEPGLGCTRRPRSTRGVGPVAPAPSCAAPWFWWR